ncbi:MAG: CapA family protein [Myxococcota bacterium]
MPIIALLTLFLCKVQADTGTPVRDNDAQADPTVVSEPPPPKPAPIRSQATIALVGDVIPHGAVKAAARTAATADNNGGWNVLLADIAPHVRAHDLAFANLETPVAPTTNKGARPFVFNAPVGMLDALQWAGFDLLSFANNHVYDQHIAGFKETLEQLESRGFTPLGAGRTCAEAKAPHIVETKGISVAMIGSSRIYNEYFKPVENEHCSNRIVSVDDLLPSVEQAHREDADIVVVSMHHGSEYKTTPNSAEIKIVHALIDAGVDVFVGHHAHVLQPIEKITTANGNTGHAVWSLGNFLTNQSAWYVHGKSKAKDGYPRDSGIVTLHVIQRGETEDTVSTAVETIEMEPVWVKYDRTKRPVRMHPVLIREAIKDIDHAIRIELDPKAVPLLKVRRKLYTDRLAQIQKVVGKEFVLVPEEPTPTLGSPAPDPPKNPSSEIQTTKPIAEPGPTP